MSRRLEVELLKQETVKRDSYLRCVPATGTLNSQASIFPPKEVFVYLYIIFSAHQSKSKRDQRIKGNGCSSYSGDIPFDFRPECLIYWLMTQFPQRNSYMVNFFYTFPSSQLVTTVTSFSTEPCGFRKGSGFLDQLRNHQRLQKESSVRSCWCLLLTVMYTAVRSKLVNGTLCIRIRYS